MGKYEILLSVCETRSISKTAQELNYTQSAISQAIKAFEKELGFQLFHRSKSGMELKPNTEEIVESLRTICREKLRIEQIAASLTSLESGYIRIGAIQSISYHWLPDILKEFSMLYPNIRFELTVDGFKNLEEKIHSQELDCIFVSEYSVPELPFIPMGDDELMLATPKGHPLSEKIAVSLPDIDNEDFVLSSDGLDYETGKIFKLNNICPKIRYRLNEDFATLKMVEQGFGVTILPKLLLYNAPFQICVRSFTEHYSRVLGVAYSKNPEPMLATLKFLDFVKAWSQKHLTDIN
ncbi:LysR family transcriptional regulator [Faecalicatena contorta]|uniref:DNA-binding transcriptional regulator, LysR family n=1 Tax=Faecalicatena contorta TaxID=39482 RepID=A0A315ZUJ1_9FIRM|nr:LysR family transcriptional regulator [Faecalicatena contorta]PWJ49236.1 DNA-binding transcriptional LysR family regulator [Faecalicatena contorta]SUQ14941.1 DNA-binding transcriptional regulator, LysR family [Faecalicatena contorta]